MEIKLNQFDCKYSVSDTGIIHSYKGTKKELVGKIKKSGYREVLINHNGKRKYKLVHRLVAENFINNPDKKRTVNHNDGDKLNNNVNNLEWMSDSENLIHARDNGLLKTKLTPMIVEQIRNDKGTIRELAKKYNIGKTQIGYIKQGKRWIKA